MKSPIRICHALGFESRLVLILMPHYGRLGQCCYHATAPLIRAGAVVLLAPRGVANSTLTRSPKRGGVRGAPTGDAKERRANGPAYRDLSDRLFEPERLEELLRGYLDQGHCHVNGTKSQRGPETTPVTQLRR